MYCGCNEWVDTNQKITSVKCDNCTDEIYNIPKQEATRELLINQYYLVVANNGFLLLTKYKPEAKIVSGWKGIIFSGIINKAHHSIVYEVIGGIEHTEKIKNIPASKQYFNKLCFDFQTLNNSGHINKVTIINNLKSKYKKAHPS